MSTITIAPEQRTEPVIGDLLDGVISGRRRRPRPAPWRALRLVHVPLVISVSVNALFFVVYWLPELGAFPGHEVILTQLVPLASKELTSRSQPVVGLQSEHLGVAAGYLLIAGLLLPPLARARFWLARLALLPLTYLGGVCVAVTVLMVLVRGQLGSEIIGVVGALAWLLAAAYTTWQSVWVEPEKLPRRPVRVGRLLVGYLFVNLVPVAVGRRVFAPELQTAAASLQHNDFALRWSALFTPATALLYLGGAAVGTLVWAGYLLWPPRRAAKMSVPLGLALVSLACVVVIGPGAARLGAQRAGLLSTASPSDEVGFTCGSWVRRPGGAPAQTWVVSGLGCRRVTSFSGYRETWRREVPASLSPVIVNTPKGAQIPGKLIAAQYGDLLVVAATTRVDNRADQVLGLRVADGVQLWRFDCPAEHTLELGLAGLPGPVAADVTGASVVIDCGAGEIRLDPRTGKTR